MIDAEAARLLDDPIWAALTTGNRGMAEGGPLARRYPPEVSPFAAIVNRTPDAFAALAALVPSGGRVVLATVDALPLLAGLEVEMQAPAIQMVLNAPIEHMQGNPEHLVLDADDVLDMLALTGLTRPGPFGSRTIEFGQYIGIRIEGKLAAMAGERMRFDRFVEISAVCVDPAHRGRGYAAILMARLSAQLQARGLTPFLHVFVDNANAIAVYEKLGFAKRRILQMTVLRAVNLHAANASSS